MSQQSTVALKNSMSTSPSVPAYIAKVPLSLDMRGRSLLKPIVLYMFWAKVPAHRPYFEHEPRPHSVASNYWLFRNDMFADAKQQMFVEPFVSGNLN